MRLRRAWLWLLAVPPLFVAGLAWLAASESGLRFIARQAVTLSDGKLAIEGAGGSLLGPLRIEKLRLENEEKHFELRDLRLDWSPRALWQRQLQLSQLELRELRVREIKPSAEPLSLPETLRLPFSLSLPSARLERLLLEIGGKEWTFSAIEFGLDKPAKTYQLNLRAFTSPWGRVQARASLGETAPFHLAGDARLRHPSGELQANVKGQLDRFQLTAGAALAGGHGEADVLLTPFARRPVATARISAEDIDPALWDKTLPKAGLSLLAELRGEEAGAFNGTLKLRNALPGTWDRGRLPLKEIDARVEGNLEGVNLSALRLDLDRAGSFSGGGRIDAGGARLDLNTQRFDPRGLHGKLHSLPLAGDIQLRADAERQRLQADLGYRRYRLHLDVEQHARVLHIEAARLSSGGGSLGLYGSLSLADGHPFDVAGALEGFDPAAYGDYPSARVNASFNAAGRLAPAPEARLIFAIADSHFRRLPLSGQGQLRVAEKRLWESDTQLRLGTNQLAIKGAFGAAGDKVTLRLRGTQLGVIHSALSGSIDASGTLSGTLAAPSGQLELTAENLGWGKDYRLGGLRAQARADQGLEGALALDAQLTRLQTPQLALAKASIAAAGKRNQHSLRLAASNPDFDLEADLAGAWRETAGKPGWSGQIERLVNRGRYPLSLLAPAQLSVGTDSLRLENAGFTALGARFKLREVAYQAGELRGNGEFTGLATGALDKLVKWPETLGGDLVFGGNWRIEAGDSINGQLNLAREGGDLMLANTGLGLTQLRLTADAKNNQLSARLEAAGSRLGRLRAQGESRLSRQDGRWGITGDAPLQASADLNLQSLAWARPLIDPRGVSIFDGQLSAKLTATGTLAAPRLGGTLAGERFTLALPEQGMNFKDGRFQAELHQDTLELKSLSLRGGDGSLSGQGRLALRADQPDMRLTLRADKLTVISRPDRLLILSGDGKLALESRKLRLDARLKADRGQFELAGEDAPSLSEDVVVLGREAPAKATGMPWDIALDLDLDLGDRFTLRARGLDAQLGGNLKLTGRQGTPPRANGSIRVVKGAYAAYGQRLNIERGILNFQGPLDNPGLNIAAWRRNQTVEAGVSITGTAQAPVVRLISNPTRPDSEKLSWLVLGHGIDEAGGQEFDLMQLAAGALLGAGESVTLQQRIAHAAGLEEVSLKGAGNLESTILTLGKRLSSRAYLSYEQGLAGSDALVKINYTLTRRLSLRAQAGTTPALDLFYTFSFD
ncbi:MAG: translocation/assembly module TamB domain-containing protein [Pseudomonadota bacterium]|nr:translocation/assembly module TamB domain-containing protein [Pseudomonadota bacterium]MDP2353700.1 translocation/assembly module TamB domain-containing protein [Pseudomonadota bacterium]